MERKNAWTTYTETDLTELEAVSQRYRSFLDAGKTERECVKEAREAGIHGKETTPFLLAKVVELTGGESLESNIQLVLNNARLAARTAAQLAE